MDQTFLTIHNLTPDANILFASDSITDILGYHAEEVQGKSCFDYFHPDEVPFARLIHNRGILLDKAAVLHYARIRSRSGRWVSCECCFTVVHDVLVACISVYRHSVKSERRAIEAPQIRRMFSCSPRDPRYHMLEHLSPKFKMPSMEREPRAAIIVNRFTRSLSIMFATNAVTSILGLDPDQILHTSFYECIQEACLGEAVRCMESAKANDSIAYLRFWSRDPRRPEDLEQESSDSEHSWEQQEEEELKREDQIKQEESDVEPMFGRSSREGRSLSDTDSGGVPLTDNMDMDYRPKEEPQATVEEDVFMKDEPDTSPALLTASTSAWTKPSASTNPSSRNSSAGTEQRPQRSSGQQRPRYPVPSVELEAVVSCTSDGLVIILRRARPQIPIAHRPALTPGYSEGLFAAPWGLSPIQPHYSPERPHTFRSQMSPQSSNLRYPMEASGGPPLDELMKSIRDVAVFAWALVGINGTLAEHSSGVPTGESQPPDGLPIWDPNGEQTQYCGPENWAAERWARLDSNPPGPYSSGHAEDSANASSAPAPHEDWYPQSRPRPS